MASVRTPKPVLLMVAAFSRHPEAIAWAREQLEQQYGPVGIESDVFSFHHTSYYNQEMGPDLRKQFFGFRQLTSEDCLPAVKHHTNHLEQQLARENRFAELRPVNLDPGILTLGKFLLATTKDQQHRIYLRDGIYAEVTLRYMDGQFQPWPWTYADYREADLHQFLQQAREYYRKRLADLLATGDSPS